MGLISQLAASSVYEWLINQVSIKMTVCTDWLRPNPQPAQQLYHASLAEARSNSFRGRDS